MTIKINVKTLIYFVFTIIFSAISATVTYAWFTNYIAGSAFKFKTATMASSITLKKGFDFNNDGILDLDSAGSHCWGPESVSTGEEILNLTVHNFMPTQIHTWSLDVKNLGDTWGYVFLRITNQNGTQSTNEGNIFKALSVTIKNQETLQPIQKFYLADYYDSTGNLDCVAINGGVENSMSNYEEDGNILYYAFSLEFETYENLPIVNGKKPLTEQEYQALQGKTFNNFFFKIYLNSYNTMVKDEGGKI